MLHTLNFWGIVRERHRKLVEVELPWTWTPNWNSGQLLYLRSQ